ncbi:MAG: trypsin-like peptidase domain-containing protein, partial [Verrucomicrobiales bacterium]|nr:trypsin-like peptidase domain-containing protein [Verrucomicrobiales bacterium]
MIGNRGAACPPRTRLQPRTSLPGWATLLLGCTLVSGAGAGERHPHVIFGEDDRLEVFEEIRPERVRLAKSVCAIVDGANLSPTASGTTLALKAETLNEALGKTRFCPGEPFGNQPRGSHCTAFLVAPDVVVTAGHCIEDECDLERFRFVFGFVMRDADTPVTEFPPEQVYRGRRLLRRVVRGDLDLAVIRLDRAVELPDVGALAIRRSGVMSSGTPVGVIGHPVGLPAKIAFGDATTVKSVSNPHMFTANLDAFGGNSGSPVFNADTLEVEGILVRGPFPEWHRTPEGCIEARRFADAFGGIEAIKIATAALDETLAAEVPTNDAFENRMTLVGETVSVVADTVHATHEPGEPDHGDGPGGRSVWWTWTAPDDGTVAISTAGSEFDTQLSVYTGKSANVLTRIASAANGGAAGTSFLVFAARQGVSYALALDGRCGLSGRAELHLDLSRIDVGGTVVRFSNPGPLE